MANNRMYLMHVPSKKAVYLGKRMGYGWYGAPEHLQGLVERLFEEAQNPDHLPCSQDDFCIVMEDISEAPHSIAEPDEMAVIGRDSHAISK